MNIAVLARIKIISGTASTFIQNIKDNTHNRLIPGHVETAIYLSASDPQEIFVLSLWQSLDDLPDLANVITAFNNQKELPGNNHNNKSVLIGSHIFMLVKDYRLVSATIKASHIRILTVTLDEPEEWLKKLAEIQLRQAKTLPGLVGGWLGRSISADSDLSISSTITTPPTLTLLNRIDWASLKEQQDFFNRQDTRETLQNFVTSGARIEFASSDLRGLIFQSGD